MKDATIFVVRKPHQGELVVENLLNYITDSCFADINGMISNLKSTDSYDEILQEIYYEQELFDMEEHRMMFHMVLSTRPSKMSQRIIDEGAHAALNYFTMLGHQALLVPHDGSENNCNNYHYHLIVNPVSQHSGMRLVDKYETYNNLREYLNIHTHHCWSWRYTNPKSYQKYIR
ncbi:MAG: hypothetical protein E7253_00845 [Lachnospiraceae bacterium]|nr:hypothetical protein [Lachnospiraceae bacterium]